MYPHLKEKSFKCIASEILNENDDRVFIEKARDFILQMIHLNEKEIIFKEVEKRWKEIFTANEDGIWEWNLKTNEVYFSETWKKMLGYKEGEIQNHVSEWEKLVHPEDIKSTMQDVQAHIDGESRQYRNEHRLLCKDGSYKWILDRGKIIEWDREGNPVRFIGTHTDISERKIAEEKMKESEALFRSIFENTSTGIALADYNGNAFMVNKAFTEMLGYPEEEFLKLNFRDFAFEEDLKKELIYFQEIIDGKREHYQMEKRYITKYGALIWAQVTVSVMRDKNGKPVMFAGLAQDLSKQKNVEQELRTVLEGKDKLMSILSHDLRSPLSGLMGLIYILKTQPEIRMQGDIYEEMHRSINSVYSLLENLLGWVQSYTGKVSFKPQLIEVRPLVYQSINSLKSFADAKEIGIYTKGLSNVQAFADKNMLSSIIRNLLSNAIKFTPKKGEVKIEVFQKDERVNFCIHDSGLGMEKEQIDNLFCHECLATSPGTDNEKGTGLGLILCKEFVEKHGGELEVNSEPGKGSRFCFYFPAGKIECQA